MNNLSLDFKEVFLELLKDNNIKDSIKKIVKEESVSSYSDNGYILKLEQELKDKNKTIDEITKKIDAMKEENKKAKQENEELQNAKDEMTKTINVMKEENEKVKQKNKDLQNEKNKMSVQITELETDKQKLEARLKKVEQFLVIWEELQMIDSELQEFIDELSGKKCIYAYMSLGRDWNKITQLQQWIKDIAVDDSRDEQVLHILNSYFCFCIELYNSTNNKKEIIQKVDIQVGDEFNSVNCIKTSLSRLNGKIQNILLSGFQTKGNKIVFPVVVKVD